ncbi:MAG: hypothetical protein KDI36_19635, partial [Pseudomonadales bacterium]|nr:hypothetical protein [Pseudomonadales bacterium]
LTYLGRTDEALVALGDNPTGAAEDIAWVTYQAARQQQSIAGFEAALAWYQQAEDSRGIGDSLFQLARQHAEQGHQRKALDFSERAERTLQAAGFEPEAESVRRWRSALQDS